MTKPAPSKVLILGAGPAGLACAYELARNGIQAEVMDRNSSVGGLCRTLDYEGYLFDIGGHRLLSKSREVNTLWHKVLGPDLIRVKRKSRIFFKGKFFDYPLSPINALRGLGLWESILCVLSYFYARVFVRCDESSFEGWMVKRFGRRLYEIFFKTYTEKVWAIPCSQLSSDWAVQRIRGLSLQKAVRGAFGWVKNGVPKTMAEEFVYPVRGPGQFCERLKALSETRGSRFSLNSLVKRVFRDQCRIEAVEFTNGTGAAQSVRVDYLFATIPLTLLVQRLVPEAPPEVLSACQNLKFRSFIVVNLIYDAKDIFPDNWIYIHSPGIRAGRIQNYKNWSPEMVCDPDKTSLGVEYFVTEGDLLWNMPDEQLIEFAAGEVHGMGMTAPDRMMKGFVVRVPNVYPVYGPAYQESLQVIRSFISKFQNLQVMGRSGLFRYDNSDHAILCGLYAARNLMGGSFDVWNVNTEQAHHEEFQATEFY